MIIVEGPDGAGKTTVLQDLKTVFDLPVAPRVVSKETEAMVDGVRAYAEEVRSRTFPGSQHTYGIAPEELDRLRHAVRARRTSMA